MRRRNKTAFFAGTLAACMVCCGPSLQAEPIAPRERVIEKAIIRLVRENGRLEGELQRLARESLSYQTQLSELRNAVNNLYNRMAAMEEGARQNAMLGSGSASVAPQEEDGCQEEAGVVNPRARQFVVFPEPVGGGGGGGAGRPVEQGAQEDGTCASPQSH